MKGRGVPKGKTEWRSTGATHPGFPDKIRAANEILADAHLDPMQSAKGKRDKKQAKVGTQRQALK